MFERGSDGFARNAFAHSRPDCGGYFPADNWPGGHHSSTGNRLGDTEPDGHVGSGDRNSDLHS